MISVIIPALNEGAVLGLLLDNLQQLRAAGHELILVDGGSGDDSVDVARRHVDRLLQSAPGRARQMNAGAAVARGRWLWFLHADSSVGPELLRQLLQASCGSRRWGWFDVRILGDSRLFPLIGGMMNRRARLTRVATGDMGLFVQAEIFRAVGGFPDIPLMEDVALSKRLRRNAGRPLVCRGPLATSGRRWQRRGVVRTMLLMWRLRLLFALGVDPARLARAYRACSSPTA